MKVQLDLYVEEVNLLLAALGKLPLEMSLGLFRKIQQQAAEQSKQPAAPPSTGA